MRWVTRKNANVDRVACPWLINEFVDPQAEFLYVLTDQFAATVERENAIPYDAPNVELGHVDGRCIFESIPVKYDVADPAVQLLGKIVHGADIPADLGISPVEAYGLRAIAYDFSYIHGDDDHKKIETPMYDALYVWCQRLIEKVAENNR